MTKILLVHGMRMSGDEKFKAKIRGQWKQGIRECLETSAWGRRNTALVPAENEIDLVFWGDLFRRPKRPAPIVVSKGISLQPIKEAYYGVVRRAVRAADRMSLFGVEGRPRGPLSIFVDELVYQSAVYMNDGPVYHPTPGVPSGAFHQIQERFRNQLNCEGNSPCVVIGHSLGSVIAYEGLCTNPHNVRTFITIGSPLATARLILDPLRKRLASGITRGSDTLPWPGVRRWDSFYAAADVLCVPSPKLARFFPGREIYDHKVVHGTARLTEKASSHTHNLLTYLAKHPDKIGNAIGEGLELCVPGVKVVRDRA